MQRLFLDTNILLVPGLFKVDIFSLAKQSLPETVELCVLEATLDELAKIAQNSALAKKERDAAKLAVLLVKQQHLKMVKGFGKSVDDLLLEKAKKGDYVATQDKALKEQLREKGIRVVTLRQKRHLIVEN
jgi:rRNA-processing protein FCF1